ncbi:hypothetical protein RRF57_002239 [Xylaria bambusicola]|uniref:Uncharacterized protein n=1 Tax=Xylaria bambusicola TaxID=326684 RepID=A0AAN7UE86_9PEZI
MLFEAEEAVAGTDVDVDNGDRSGGSFLIPRRVIVTSIMDAGYVYRDNITANTWKQMIARRNVRFDGCYRQRRQEQDVEKQCDSTVEIVRKDDRRAN